MMDGWMDPIKLSLLSSYHHHHHYCYYHYSYEYSGNISAACSTSLIVTYDMRKYHNDDEQEDHQLLRCGSSYFAL